MPQCEKLDVAKLFVGLDKTALDSFQFCIEFNPNLDLSQPTREFPKLSKFRKNSKKMVNLIVIYTLK